MSIKSILAVYSGDATGSSGLSLALLMARKWGANITGVVWHGPSMLETGYRQYMPKEVLEVLAARDAEAVSQIRTDFEARMQNSGAGISASFLELAGASDFSLASCARGYDIVVMGGRAADVGREHFAARPDVVALQSGRPLVLAPHGYVSDCLPEHAVVAWDGRRAAARALGDAMHILETKERVTVLIVGDEPRQGPGDNIMRLLERHGIPADRLIRPAKAGAVGRTILDTCVEVGAGLLVMGAYEHSKFGERMLGEVSSSVLDHADLPVLMSH